MEAWSSKIKTALQKEAIHGGASRKEWPLDVLRGVFDALVEETPRQLLAQELYAKSASSSDWWETTGRFM